MNENFIYEMTRDNNTERNIEGLRTLYINSSPLATIEEDKQMIPNRGNYPFSSLVNLNPKAQPLRSKLGGYIRSDIHEINTESLIYQNIFILSW